MSESQLVTLQDHYRGRIKSRNGPEDVADMAFGDAEITRRRLHAGCEGSVAVTAIDMAGDMPRRS